MELYLHSKIHLQPVHRNNLTVTFMTRLRSLGKMTQLRKKQTPRMAVLVCEGGEGAKLLQIYNEYSFHIQCRG